MDLRHLTECFLLRVKPPRIKTWPKRENPLAFKILFKLVDSEMTILKDAILGIDFRGQLILYRLPVFAELIIPLGINRYAVPLYHRYSGHIPATEQGIRIDMPSTRHDGKQSS